MARGNIDLRNSVNLDEAKSLVKSVGSKVSIIFEGEPGIGKSAILKDLAKEMPTHVPIYLDLPLFDIGDTSGVPHVETVDRGNGDVLKITRFAPAAVMGVHSKKPVILMLDEFGKAMRPVQNTMLRTLLERKVGEYSLPPGSIVFGTTNLSSDGVGDSVQAHARNRVSCVTVRKSSAEEWKMWAVDNGVAPEVITWVGQYPQALASYREGNQNENPYIYHPNKSERAFVTPRSLEHAGHIITERGHLTPNALIAAVSGAVGEAAARDLVAYAELADKLPTWEQIVKDPMKAPLPTEREAAAGFITVFGAVMRVEQNTLDPFMKYVGRMKREFQAVFAVNAARSKNKRGLVMANKSFVKWATENQWIFAGEK